MAQTLCAHLRCAPNSLQDLNRTFSSTVENQWSAYTSDISDKSCWQTPYPENNNICLIAAGQIRSQFSKVIDFLTSQEQNESTIAEEWPNALEFDGWASDDCVEFCNSHGLIDDLRNCRIALSTFYSNIIKSNAEIDFYQETDTNDEGHIVIRLEIKSDRKTYKEEYESWINWMVENLSNESRMLISVSIDRL